MSKCLDPFRFLLISLAGWMNQQWPTSPRPIKPRSHDRSHAGISHERLARRRYAPCSRFWRLLFDPWSFRDTRRVKFRSFGRRCNPWLGLGCGGSGFRAIRVPILCIEAGMACWSPTAFGVAGLCLYHWKSPAFRSGPKRGAFCLLGRLRLDYQPRRKANCRMRAG